MSFRGTVTFRCKAQTRARMCLHWEEGASTIPAVFELERKLHFTRKIDNELMTYIANST